MYSHIVELNFASAGKEVLDILCFMNTKNRKILILLQIFKEILWFYIHTL